MTFQLSSENKHILALDFLSWIMVRIVLNLLVIPVNNAKPRREMWILMDSQQKAYFNWAPTAYLTKPGRLSKDDDDVNGDAEVKNEFIQ